MTEDYLFSIKLTLALRRIRACLKMSSPQFSVRIPPELDKKGKEYVIKNDTIKSHVMIAALARYLDCESKVP